MTKPNPNRKCKCGAPVTGRAFLCPTCKEASQIKVRKDGHCWCGYESRPGLRVCERCTKNQKASNALRKGSPAAMQSNLKTRVKRYGLSVEQYLLMLEGQDGLCAICLKPETEIKRGTLAGLAVDHDHVSGLVRGLLCSRCNKGIGLLQDNPDRMRRAALYVERAA